MPPIVPQNFQDVPEQECIAILIPLPAEDSAIHKLPARLEGRCLLIDLWRDAGDAFEHSAEILHIRNAALQCNGLDGKIRCQHKQLRVSDAAAVYVLRQRNTHLFLNSDER